MRIAIIGASRDRTKYGNKAVRAYVSTGHRVYPINPREQAIEGLRCYASVRDVPDRLDAASFYVPPDIGLGVADEVVAAQIPLVYLNPGAERDDLVEKLHRAGMTVRMTCSILAIGINPGTL